MPNFTNYRKSISQELISTKDRVRDFIDNRHWGEDGKEAHRLNVFEIVIQ